MLRQASDESEHSPLLKDEGRRLLRWMREHPCAPRFNFECGDHLAFHHWAWLKGFEGLLRQGFRWPEQGPPAWVWPFACSALERVPYYRSYGECSGWHDLPPLDKEVLRRQPQMLVPDDVSLEDMVVYDTSGTTGNKMLVPSAPTVSASYLPLLCYGLSLYGVQLEPTPGRVAFLQVGLQQSTLTYAMISSFLDQSGFAKLNLNPKEWREPEHRARYIDDCQPQVLTGNPLAFAELARLPLKHQPKALVSSAMTLMPGARLELERHFGCPVFDMYSMTECMAIALKRDESSGHRVLSHDLYVEVLDDRGKPVAHGQRGEVALTGGRNPYLPLLRYRTRDHARVEVREGVPFLMGLEGRSPVQFETREGHRFNNIDVTHALARFALIQFSLHQNQDLSLRFRYRDTRVSEPELEEALRGVFGDLPICFETAAVGEVGEREKWIQYSSDR